MLRPAPLPLHHSVFASAVTAACNGLAAAACCRLAAAPGAADLSVCVCCRNNTGGDPVGSDGSPAGGRRNRRRLRNMTDLTQGAIAAIVTCGCIVVGLFLCCIPRSAPFFSLRNRVVVVTGGSRCVSSSCNPRPRQAPLPSARLRPLLGLQPLQLPAHPYDPCPSPAAAVLARLLRWRRRSGARTWCCWPAACRRWRPRWRR